MFPTLILTRAFAISALVVGAAPLAYAAPIDLSGLSVRSFDERSACCVPNGECGCTRADAADEAAIERAFEPEPILELPALATLRFDKRFGCWMAGREDGCLRREDVELLAREPSPEFSPELVEFLRREPAPEPEPHVNPDVRVREPSPASEELVVAREPVPEPEPESEPVVERELDERMGCWMPGGESACL